jgi:hypothetical protein
MGSIKRSDWAEIFEVARVMINGGGIISCFTAYHLANKP